MVVNREEQQVEIFTKIAIGIKKCSFSPFDFCDGMPSGRPPHYHRLLSCNRCSGKDSSPFRVLKNLLPRLFLCSSLVLWFTNFGFLQQREKTFFSKSSLCIDSAFDAIVVKRLPYLEVLFCISITQFSLLATRFFPCLMLVFPHFGGCNFPNEIARIMVEGEISTIVRCAREKASMASL